MKIKTIFIKNFRLIKDITIELEETETETVIVGKNNTGKTSFITLIDKFINKTKFYAEDFNLNILAEFNDYNNFDKNKLNALNIELDLVIRYDSNDKLDMLSNFITNLDTCTQEQLLKFSFGFIEEKTDDFVKEINEYKNTNNKYSFIDFLKETNILSNFFERKYYTIDPKDTTNYNETTIDDIKKLIMINIISATRDVDSSDETRPKYSLSRTIKSLLEKYKSDEEGEYKKVKSQDINNSLNDFINNLQELYYAPFFNSKIKERLKDFMDGEFYIDSLINKTRILDNDVMLKYGSNKCYLPEHYNGLGYLNLINIILYIVAISEELKQSESNIKLMMIEEPEAHTHPQMQYTFIKNINDTIKNCCGNEIQTIITTHSAHIVSQSNFSSIRYFTLEKSNLVVKKIENICDKESDFSFLKKYLTIQNSELFFTDKAIIVEGTSERILLPAIMKKIDNSNNTKNYKPLTSQYISLIEVGGAYAHILCKFLSFLNIKTLIITDIDSCNGKQNNKSCCVNDGNTTSNACLNYFFEKDNFEEIKNKKTEKQIFTFDKTNNKYEPFKNGNIHIVYQKEENNYHARSLEDSFIAINKDFIKNNSSNTNSIFSKLSKDIDSCDIYSAACSISGNKTQFATDILYYSDESFSNWNIPKYIEKGLKWLQK